MKIRVIVLEQVSYVSAKLTGLQKLCLRIEITKCSEQGTEAYLYLQRPTRSDIRHTGR
jgi:hypothetical protein